MNQFAGFAAVNEDMPDVSELPVRDALITLLEKALDGVEGRTGTVIRA